MQRTEISDQCRVLGCRAAVAVQNVDDVCEEHGERVPQLSNLWSRDSTAGRMWQCIRGLVRRTESSDNDKDVTVFTFQSGIAVRFSKWHYLLILTRSCSFFAMTFDCTG